MIDYLLLAKAAMLHDIGKLCYRAGMTDDSEAYAQFGAQWLARLLPQEDERAQQLLRCVSYHRRRDLKTAGLAPDDWAYIIYLADAIAFGAEKAERTADAEFDAGLCLESVFNYFSDKETHKRYFLPKEMNIAKEINYAVRDDIKAGAEDYRRILQIIETRLKQKPLLEMYPYELLQLLEDTLYYLPLTVRKDLPRDISLYEHAKYAAALAVAIAHYCEANGITDYAAMCSDEGIAKLQDEPLFLIVSADIAGIYGFLTTPAAQAPLASMRGRSLYLEYFSQLLADEMIYHLKLTKANVIYTGGGRIYLTAPNTPQLKKELDGLAEYVNSWLLENYGNQLYVAFGTAECTPLELAGRRLGSDILARVDLEVENRKKNRYPVSVLKELFDPQSSLNAAETGTECSVCHHELSRGDEKRNDGLCSFCRSLLELGKSSFTEDRVLAICTNHAGGSAAVPGWQRPLYLKLVAAKDLEKFKAHNKILHIYSTKGGDAGEYPIMRLRRCDYFVRDAKSGRVLDAEKLAESSMGETYTGVKRLGVLMADVDAIGMALKVGFYRNDLHDPLHYLTSARQITLSSRLSFFFKVILNKIFKGEAQTASGKGRPPFRLFNKPKQSWRNIHVIYSGGDNIFLLGAWDDVVEVAVDIHRAFTAYTSGKLAFSAGIGVFTPDFPMSQMFIQAALLKKTAKNVPGTGKIALFGQGADFVSGPGESLAHVYDWDDFETQVCAGKLQFLTDKLSFGLNTVPGKIKTDRNTLYKLHGVLASAGGKFNLAEFAYAVALLEPRQDSAEATEVYNELRRALYGWALDKEGRRQLLTALELLIYSLPNAPKEDF